MIQLLAHITEQEVPSFWLAALLGFVAGMGVMYGLLVRKLK
jgi:hypothetical protein